MFTRGRAALRRARDRRHGHRHRHRRGRQPDPAGRLPADRRRVGRPAAAPEGDAGRRLPALRAAAARRRRCSSPASPRSGTSPLLQVGDGRVRGVLRPRVHRPGARRSVSPPRLQQANALQGLVMSGSITLGRVPGRPARGGGRARAGRIGIDGLTLPGERLVPAAAAAAGVPRPAAPAADSPPSAGARRRAGGAAPSSATSPPAGASSRATRGSG